MIQSLRMYCWLHKFFIALSLCFLVLKPPLSTIWSDSLNWLEAHRDSHFSKRGMDIHPNIDLTHMLLWPVWLSWVLQEVGLAKVSTETWIAVIPNSWEWIRYHSYCIQLYAMYQAWVNGMNPTTCNTQLPWTKPSLSLTFHLGCNDFLQVGNCGWWPGAGKGGETKVHFVRPFGSNASCLDPWSGFGERSGFCVRPPWSGSCTICSSVGPLLF